MGKKLHVDMAAEQEANDIGRKFMNSTDVVGDMSRAYGADLSSVKIHTDSAAAGMAAQRGVDAFSTGKDVFFGQGVFDKNNPESRGLLAHELSHSLQQGVGGMGGMQQSAPLGAEQGGWLGNLFRRKKKKMPTPEQMEHLDEDSFEELDVANILEMDRSSAVKDKYVDWMMQEHTLPELTQDKKYIDEDKHDYLTRDSYLFGQFLQSLSGDELNTEFVRQMAMQDYVGNMNSRLDTARNGLKEGTDLERRNKLATNLRGAAGELFNVNKVLAAMLPKNMSEKLAENAAPEKIAAVPRNDFLIRANYYNPTKALDYASGVVEGNDTLKEFLLGMTGGFEGIEEFGDEDVQSDFMMSNLMLRGIVPKLSDDYAKELARTKESFSAEEIEKSRAEANVGAKADMKVSFEKELLYQTEKKMYESGREYSKLGTALQKDLVGTFDRVNGKSESAKKFTGLLANIMKKKRENAEKG